MSLIVCSLANDDPSHLFSSINASRTARAVTRVYPNCVRNRGSAWL